MSSDSDSEQFKQTVSMTVGSLEKWLKTGQSQGAGQKRGKGETTGHASGRRIVEILRTKRSDLSDDGRTPVLATLPQGRRLCEAPSGAATGRRCQRHGSALLADQLGSRPNPYLTSHRNWPVSGKFAGDTLVR